MIQDAGPLGRHFRISHHVQYRVSARIQPRTAIREFRSGTRGQIEQGGIESQVLSRSAVSTVKWSIPLIGIALPWAKRDPCVLPVVNTRGHGIWCKPDHPRSMHSPVLLCRTAIVHSGRAKRVGTEKLSTTTRWSRYRAGRRRQTGGSRRRRC